MRQSRIVYDGLWRCLCPSFDSQGLAAAARIQAQRRAAVPSQSCARSNAIQSTYRSYTTSRVDRATTETRQTGQWSATEKGKRAKRLKKKDAKPSKRSGNGLLDAGRLEDSELHRLSEQDIKLAILRLRDGKPIHGFDDEHRYGRITRLAQYLVAERKHPADAFVYESLMAAMAIPEWGSSEGMLRLIQDMEQQGLKPTPEFCQVALAANMNHPSYTVRGKILDLMKEYWFEVDSTANESVVISMLREQNYELAYDKLMDMIERGDHISSWGFDIFVVGFSEKRFLDEVVMLISQRKLQHSDTPSNVMLIALDIASKENHYASTVLVWNDLVKPGIGSAADGVVNNVLNVAARHGDSKLASEAFGLLSQRIKVQDYHFEAVAEAFIEGGDLVGAARTLIIAHRTMDVDDAMTARLLWALDENPKALTDVEAEVRSLRDTDGDKIPVSIVAHMILSKAQTQSHSAVKELLSEHEAWTGQQPSADTILSLIASVTSPSKFKTSLCKEYLEKYTVKEDPERPREFVNEFIVECIEGDCLDMALRWANNYLDKGWGEGAVWVSKLVGSMIELEDGRVWDLVDRLQESEDENMQTAVRMTLRKYRLQRNKAT